MTILAEQQKIEKSKNPTRWNHQETSFNKGDSLAVSKYNGWSERKFNLFQTCVKNCHQFRAVYKNDNIIQKPHLKNFNALLHERNQINGIASNPNNIITNLSNHTLNNDEYNVLKHGLKYGISFSHKSYTVLAYSDDVRDQIRKSGIYYNNEYDKIKIKNALRSYAFNLIDIDDKNIFKDTSKIKIIRHLRKTLLIMKLTNVMV